MNDLEDLEKKWENSALELREAERFIKLLIADNLRLKEELLEANEEIGRLADRW